MPHTPADRAPWIDFTDTLETGSLLVSQRFDPVRTLPSLAVLTALGRVEWIDPAELPPLYDFGIDLEALDSIAPPATTERTDEIPEPPAELMSDDGSGGSGLGVLLRIGRYLLCCDPVAGVVDVYDSPRLGF